MPSNLLDGASSSSDSEEDVSPPPRHSLQHTLPTNHSNQPGGPPPPPLRPAGAAASLPLRVPPLANIVIMPVRRYTATADGARFLEGEGVLHLTGGVLRHVCCPSSSYDSTPRLGRLRQASGKAESPREDAPAPPPRTLPRARAVPLPRHHKRRRPRTSLPQRVIIHVHACALPPDSGRHAPRPAASSSVAGEA